MVIARENFSECVSKFELSIEGRFKGNSSIESHQKGWIFVVMLGNWRVIEVIKA